MPLEHLHLDDRYPLDPRPFYRAVLASPNDGDRELGHHDINHRPGLVWNAAFGCIRLWFHGRRPGRKPRQGLINRIADTYAGTEHDPVPLVTIGHYIDITFDPQQHVDNLKGQGMQRLGETALLIPYPIAHHYAWRPGEREALITSLALFDHTNLGPFAGR